jgi:hypothetical protein
MTDIAVAVELTVSRVSRIAKRLEADEGKRQGLTLFDLLFDLDASAVTAHNPVRF